MQPYANRTGRSGVVAFAPGPDFLDVEFAGGRRYRYTHLLPGRREVETMKRLAAEGTGLATYISRHNGERYFARLA